MTSELVQEALDQILIGGDLGETFRFRQKDVNAIRRAMVRNNPSMQYDRKRIVLKGSEEGPHANRLAGLGEDDCDSCHPMSLQGQELEVVDGYVDLEVIMSRKDKDVGSAVVRFDTRTGTAEVVRSQRNMR